MVLTFMDVIYVEYSVTHSSRKKLAVNKKIIFPYSFIALEKRIYIAYTKNRILIMINRLHRGSPSHRILPLQSPG